MSSKNPLRFGLIGLVVLASLVVLFYPTDEKRVRAAAEALVSAANGSEADLQRALDQYAAPGVSINVSDPAESLTGRAALLAAVRNANAMGLKLRLHLEAVEVSLSGNVARVNADLVTADRPEVPELRRPRRSVALFERRADGFRLLSAEIGPERRDQPEARP
jgi:hypothetical protein